MTDKLIPSFEEQLIIEEEQSIPTNFSIEESTSTDTSTTTPQRPQSPGKKNRDKNKRPSSPGKKKSNKSEKEKLENTPSLPENLNYTESKKKEIIDKILVNDFLVKKKVVYNKTTKETDYYYSVEKNWRVINFNFFLSDKKDFNFSTHLLFFFNMNEGQACRESNYEPYNFYLTLNQNPTNKLWGVYEGYVNKNDAVVLKYHNNDQGSYDSERDRVESSVKETKEQMPTRNNVACIYNKNENKYPINFFDKKVNERNSLIWCLAFLDIKIHNFKNENSNKSIDNQSDWIRTPKEYETLISNY